MALAGFVPEIWSGRVLARLNDALVYKNVCTTEYEGEISGFGDVVKINEIGPITVNSYSATSTGALTVQQLTDAQKLLQINQSKYFAFWLDDQDNARIKPKVLGEALDNSAWALANNIDEYIATLYTDAGLAIGGTSTTGVDVTATNVLKYLSLAQQKLDEMNTPMAGRWVVVPPWFQQKMTLANVALNTDNVGTLGAGYIGRTFYGFDIWVSNNVYHASGTDRAAIMFGYPGSIAMAVQVLATRQESSGTIGFKTLVKGLVVYGAKVVRPNNLGILWADYTAEAT
jgi:hypothetical protein